MLLLFWIFELMDSLIFASFLCSVSQFGMEAILLFRGSLGFGKEALQSLVISALKCTIINAF